MTSAHAQRARLQDALLERAARAVGETPCKVLALKIGTSERHVRGIKAREHACGAAALFFLCQQDAELREWCVALLNVGPSSPEGQRLIAAIEGRLGGEALP